MSHLKLGWLERPGVAKIGRLGGSITSRRYLDFNIDGESLRDVVDASSRDLIGRLGWCSPAEDRTAVDQLLLRQPAPLPEGRQLLYVCPECGDIGCGAITAFVEAEGDVVIWRDFGYENDYDPNMTDRDSLSRVGPFRFHLVEYTRVLTEVLDGRGA